MEKLRLKAHLLVECKKMQQKVLDNLRNTMNEAQQSANEYGPPKDRYDAFRMQLLRRKDMYGQMLAKALEEFNALEKIDPSKEKEKVEFGAMVFTSEQKLFVSIGLGKVIFDQNSYYAVSVNVPLCKAIAGKKKGEIADFNGKPISIIDVF